MIIIALKIKETLLKQMKAMNDKKAVIIRETALRLTLLLNFLISEIQN